MIFLAGFWDNVGSAILEALRSLMLSLCDIIYKLIVFFFDIFLMLGNSSLLEDSIVSEIYHRVGLILGLFMVFRVVFSLIQYVMNPDTMFDKQKGVFNIVKRMFIVVVLLGTTPYLFDLAFDAQRLIVDSNIIPKVITGKNVGTEDFGSTLAWYAFSSFYKFDERVSDADKLKCDILSDGILENDFKANNTLDYAYNCVNEKVASTQKEKIFLIDFVGGGLVAVIVGALILWMIIMYVIQVGVRVIQLAYLELIAPIPIIGYLAPKGENTLNKWVKQCTTTYLDFFIRIGVIYLVIFIIGLLIGNDSEHFVDSLNGATRWDMVWITIIMIIALLIFAKKVPNLLKELFPMSGGAAKFDLGLKAPKEAKQVFGTIAGAATGAAVGLIGGPGVGGRVKGLVGGFFKGGYSGWNGKKASEVASARAAQNVRNRQIQNSDSTFGGRMDASFRNAVGLESRTELIDKDIKAIDKENNRIDNEEIRSRRDAISLIRNGRMREIDDSINAIRNGDKYKAKSTNDQIISARNAILDKAKEELTKSNAAVIGASARLDYLSSHHGEVDKLTGNIIDGTMISDQKASLKQIIDNESNDWIKDHFDSDETVLKNRQIIASNAGVKLDDISDIGTISKIYDSAKSSNASLAVDIQQKEFEIQTLNDEKRVLEGNIETINREISQFEQQKDSNNRRKEGLEKSKKKPQADIDAVKKK